MLVPMDIQSYQECEETLSLLKILAMGNKQIEEGKYRPAHKVFAEMGQQDRA